MKAMLFSYYRGQSPLGSDRIRIQDPFKRFLQEISYEDFMSKSDRVISKLHDVLLD